MLVASKFNKTWPSMVFSKRGLYEPAVILVAMPTEMGETLHRSAGNAEIKLHITPKWCEIWQKFVLTTKTKPWVGFTNPPLL